MNDPGPSACLVVIDLINDIVAVEGAMAASAGAVHHRGIFAKTNEAVRVARARGWLVAWVRVGFSEDYREAPKHSPIFERAKKLEALRLGTWGTEWHPDVEIGIDDARFVKNGISAFSRSGLGEWLEGIGPTDLIVSGVSSMMAVEATIREAHDRGYACHVLEDACAAPQQLLHESAMRVCGMLGRVIQVSQLRDLSNSPESET